MKTVYEEKIKNLINNYLVLREQFLWENDLSKHLVSLAYTMNNKEININEIKEIKEYIKNRTTIFSSFRGNMAFTLSGLLSANSHSAKEHLDFMIDNERILKDAGFKSFTYLPIALYALSSTYDGYDVKEQVKKAVIIYKEMKKNHPFLTSGDDYALSILLANTNHDIRTIEEYYRGLNNKGLNKSNGLQMLSHILSFSGNNVDETIDNCIDIYEQLKSNKLKISTSYYPAIGIMSLIPDNEGKLKNDVIEIAKFLKTQKKYMWLDKGMNVLISASLIASEYIEEQTNKDLVSTSINVSIQAIIAAQQAAMVATMSASIGASSSN